jgi:hypothetical protein
MATVMMSRAWVPIDEGGRSNKFHLEEAIGGEPRINWKGMLRTSERVDHEK